MPQSSTILKDYWMRLTKEEKDRLMLLLEIKSRSAILNYIENPHKIRCYHIPIIADFLRETLESRLSAQDLFQKISELEAA